jgi:DNA-binding response OmpR family regulator
VVDDDRRVLELLEIAFGTQGFKVLMASDGDEAVRSAMQEKPDLIVLDIRLPRRSGLDVCEMLRRDLPDPGVPILVISAAVETETRLQAFARGADDFLAKPFSPKELVARVRRLLVRTGEAREARQRIHDLERDLGQAHEAMQRAHQDARREQRLHQLVTGPGHALHRSLDADEVIARLLFDTQNRLNSSFVALLWSEREGEPLRPWAARGETIDRIAALEVARLGPLGSLLEGLGRPVLRRELDRFPELRPELQSFLAHGITVLVPLAGANGLEGLLLADERPDGGEPDALEMELLAQLCGMASAALHNAAQVREQLLIVLARLAGAVAPTSPSTSREKAAQFIERVARVMMLPPRQRTLLGLALRIAPATVGAPWRDAIESLSVSDATGMVSDLLRLEERATWLEPVTDDWLPEEGRAPLLLWVGRAYAAALESGDDAANGLERALAGAGSALDPATAESLRGALRESGQKRPAAR